MVKAQPLERRGQREQKRPLRQPVFCCVENASKVFVGFGSHVDPIQARVKRFRLVLPRTEVHRQEVGDSAADGIFPVIKLLHPHGGLIGKGADFEALCLVVHVRAYPYFLARDRQRQSCYHLNFSK